ncbi:hypothetical protein HispidOSU_006853 [Sigmodon hispidus]
MKKKDRQDTVTWESFRNDRKTEARRKPDKTLGVKGFLGDKNSVADGPAVTREGTGKIQTLGTTDDSDQGVSLSVIQVSQSFQMGWGCPGGTWREADHVRVRHIAADGTTVAVYRPVQTSLPSLSLGLISFSMLLCLPLDEAPWPLYVL